MSFQLTILPTIKYPKEDELFSSWLFRLAIGNITKAHSFTKFHLKDRNVWNRDIDRLISNEMIQRLSLLTEISFEDIFNLTLKSYEGSLFEKCNTNTRQKWVLTLGIYHRTWQNKGLQFCPKCLASDDEPYFRKSWRLGTSIICTKCQLLLHDCCPACNSPISFFRTDIGFKISIGPMMLTDCIECGFDLRLSPRYPPMIGSTAYQIKINNILKAKTWKTHPSVEYFNVLYTVAKYLRSNSKFYARFNSVIMDSESSRVNGWSKERDFERINTFDREHLLRIGSWILEDWPSRFIDLCKEGKLSTVYVLKDSKSNPEWFIKEAVSKLHQPSATDLNLTRKRK